MSKEFVMGARINMTDGFSSPVSRMTSTTQQFSNAARQGDRAVSNLGRSAYASNAGVRAFTAGSRAATTSTRGLASGVTTLSASMRGLSGIMKTMTGVLTFKIAYDWLVGSNAQMEQYKNTLAVVLKSQERATETLSWATKFAADTPFEIPEVVEATTRLSAYGITAQKTLGTIGDMASVMGKPLMQAVEAVADAQTGELERLKEFGITKDMLINQAAKMGTEVVNNKGQITDQVAFNATLFTLMEERYEDGMAMQAKTFKGMLSNAADFIGTMGREFGTPIFERMKAGLAGVLDFFDKIQEDGTMEAITAKAQAFGNSVADIFSFAFGIAERIFTVITDKVGVFLDTNAPRFAALSTSMGGGFNTLGAIAMPILNWLIDTALPMFLDALMTIGEWVISVAEFFINNWAHIEPFVTGIAVVLGLIIGPIGAMIGYMYLVAQAMKVWAAAQAVLNIVMALSPIFLLILGIGLLIGAAIWVVRNWETVSAFFSTLWESILQGLTAAMTWVTMTVSDTLAKVALFFIDLIPQALEWGATLIRTFVDGILSMKNYLVDGVSNVFSAVRKLMPFSDAKAGPFSQLTYSGGAIMSTMAQGVTAQAPTLHSAMSDAFNQAPTMNAGVSATGARVTSASVPITANNAKANSARSVIIEKLIEKIVISGVDKDPRQLAEEIIEILHEKLAGANDIISDDMGGLL